MMTVQCGPHQRADTTADGRRGRQRARAAGIADMLGLLRRLLMIRAHLQEQGVTMKA